MIIRGEITKGKLEIIYKTIQDIIPEEHCYYTEEDIKEMRKDKNNIFIDEKGWNYERQSNNSNIVPNTRYK